MRSIPTVIATDAEDVIWALQTADALWKREERVDAIVWLRRAAQAAGEAEDDDRALTLARDAAELAEWIAQNPGIDDADVQDAPTTAPPAAGEAVDDLLRGPRDEIPMDEPTPVVDIAITMAPPSVAPSPSPSPPAPRSPVPPVPRSPLPPVLQSAPPAPGHVPTAAEAHAGMLDPWGDPEAPTRSRPVVPPPVPVAPPPPPPRAFESDEVVTSAPPVPPLGAESKAPAETKAAVAPAPPRPPPRPGGPPPAPSRVQPPPLRAEPPPLEPPTPSPTPSRAAPAPQATRAAPKAPPPKPAAQPPREAPPQTAPKPPREAPPQAAPKAHREAPPQAAPKPASQAPPEAAALDGNLDPALESALEAAAQPEPLAPAEPEPLAAGETEPRPAAPAAPQPAREPAPEAAPEPTAPSNGVDLSEVEALSDLPDDARDAFANAARVQILGREDEVSAFALALVLEGDVDVAATIVDAPAQRMSAGAVMRARGTIAPFAPVRLIGASASARVATWDEHAVTEAFRTCPWVEDELRSAGNRLQALVGITMGPLGERLDPSLRADVMSRLQLRALAEHEVIATRGGATVGLLLVGGGELELLGDDGEPNGTVLGPGEFLFPNESLRAAPAPSTVRASTGGALVLLAERGVAQELLVTCPPLLEIFAGM